MKLGDALISLPAWDTVGDSEYDRFRPLTFPGTDVMLLVYSVIDRQSFENVEKRWMPEILHYAPGVPCILIGNLISFYVSSMTSSRDFYLRK